MEINLNSLPKTPEELIQLVYRLTAEVSSYKAELSSYREKYDFILSNNCV